MIVALRRICDSPDLFSNFIGNTLWLFRTSSKDSSIPVSSREFAELIAREVSSRCVVKNRSSCKLMSWRDSQARDEDAVDLNRGRVGFTTIRMPSQSKSFLLDAAAQIRRFTELVAVCKACVWLIITCLWLPWARQTANYSSHTASSPSSSTKWLARTSRYAPPLFSFSRSAVSLQDSPGRHWNLRLISTVFRQLRNLSQILLTFRNSYWTIILMEMMVHCYQFRFGSRLTCSFSGQMKPNHKQILCFLIFVRVGTRVHLLQGVLTIHRLSRNILPKVRLLPACCFQCTLDMCKSGNRWGWTSSKYAICTLIPYRFLVQLYRISCHFDDPLRTCNGSTSLYTARMRILCSRQSSSKTADCTSVGLCRVRKLLLIVSYRTITSCAPIERYSAALSTGQLILAICARFVRFWGFSLSLGWAWVSVYSTDVLGLSTVEWNRWAFCDSHHFDIIYWRYFWRSKILLTHF